MDFAPELLNGGVVLNPMSICTNGTTDCKVCPESAVAIHNWLVSTELKYLIIDFQDEKEVCPSILVELMQLRKRLRFPFLFVGLMERPRQMLQSYAYNDFPIFDTPEDAIAYASKHFAPLMDVDLSLIRFGEAIPTSRSRMARPEVEEEEVEETED